MSKNSALLVATALISAGCAGIDYAGSTSELCGALCTAIESVETIIESGDTTGLGEAQASLSRSLAIAASSSVE